MFFFQVVVFKNGSKLLSQGVKFEPLSVDVSPNGSLIAVGGDQVGIILIYDMGNATA